MAEYPAAFERTVGVLPVNRTPVSVYTGKLAVVDIFRTFPDLSFHEETLDPELKVILFRSAASNHNRIPATDFGVKLVEKAGRSFPGWPGARGPSENRHFQVRYCSTC